MMAGTTLARRRTVRTAAAGQQKHYAQCAFVLVKSWTNRIYNPTGRAEVDELRES